MKKLAFSLAATAAALALAPAASAAPIVGSFSLGGFNGSFVGPVGATAATATGLDFGTAGGVGNGYGIAGTALVGNAVGSFASLNGTTANIADIALGLVANPTPSTSFITFGSSNIVVNFANALITRSPSGTSVTVAGGATFSDGVAADATTGLFSLVVNSMQGNPTDANFTFTSNVSAVPEPAAWAMMILGMGAIGFAMRRRQSVRVTYA